RDRSTLLLHDDPPTPQPGVLSLHDARPISWQVRAALEATLLDGPVADVPDPLVTEHDRIRYMLTARARRAVRDWAGGFVPAPAPDRKSTRLNSSHVKSSYAVFCLKKKQAGT